MCNVGSKSYINLNPAQFEKQINMMLTRNIVNMTDNFTRKTAMALATK